ncbi:MAG: hypothetical protein KF861_15885, partial [Planctomycetaceae bacterium]|nr:hypothetical protein [Planctomycetaceae bacterium]
FILAAVKWSARPSSWYWLVPPTTRDQIAAPPLDAIDFRIPPEQRERLPPGTFRATAADDNDALPAADISDDDVLSFTLAPELLATIQDNTLGLRRREAAAYHEMLSRIDRLPEAAAANRARSDVAFTVLMQAPQEYRGELLSVEGDLRRLTPLAANDESGFDTLYEGWLFTRDSGTNPYRIVLTQVPDGVPIGETIDPPTPVRVVGYFFKRYGYASQGGQHVAPLLLAKTLHPLPRPVTLPTDGDSLKTAMGAFVAVVIAGIVALGAWFFLSDRRFRSSRLQRLAAARSEVAAEQLAALADVDVVDPERMFDAVDAASDRPTASEPSPPVTT